MKARYYTFGIALLALLFLAGMSGCAQPVKVTGGGTLTYEDGSVSTEANFGFNGLACKESLLNYTISGRFNYIDQFFDNFGIEKGGVKMNGEVIDAEECKDTTCYGACESCEFLEWEFPYYAITFNYVSTNPFFHHRESGEGFACVKDNGEGAGADPDMAYVQITAGPYTGYWQEGEVEGNIKVRPPSGDDCL